MKEHLKLLGHQVRDIVTGFEGTATTIGFDLYGCVQAIVAPKHNPESKESEGERSRWFDTKRLTVISDAPVMAVPTFDLVPGGSEKPSRSSNPIR